MLVKSSPLVDSPPTFMESDDHCQKEDVTGATFIADHDEYLCGKIANLWISSQPDKVRVRFFDPTIHTELGVLYFYMPSEWFQGGRPSLTRLITG